MLLEQLQLLEPREHLSVGKCRVLKHKSVSDGKIKAGRANK